MKKSACIVASMLVVICLAQAPVYAQDPGAPDVVSIESVTVLPGASFGLNVNAVTDQALQAAELGIKWSSSSLSLDSVTYPGGLVGAAFSTGDPYLTLIDTSVTNEALALFITRPPFYFPAGSATLFTYWFTASSTVTNEVVLIDSSSVIPPNGEFVLGDSTNVIFIPQFQSGTVTISCSDNTDPDGDGVLGCLDNCPLTFNPSQTDSDGDGLGDDCDNCPLASNPSQVDSDADGIADACDNCPSIANPGQEDANNNSFGDVCDGDIFCAVPGDANGDGVANIADITYMITFIFLGGPAPVCP